MHHKALNKIFPNQIDSRSTEKEDVFPFACSLYITYWRVSRDPFTLPLEKKELFSQFKLSETLRRRNYTRILFFLNTQIACLDRCVDHESRSIRGTSISERLCENLCKFCAAYATLPWHYDHNARRGSLKYPRAWPRSTYKYLRVNIHHIRSRFYVSCASGSERRRAQRWWKQSDPRPDGFRVSLMAAIRAAPRSSSQRVPEQLTDGN